MITNCPFRSRNNTRPKNEGFELLWHGNLWPNHGCEELIAAAPALARQGITCRIRGYGPRLEYYRHEAAKAGDCVVFEAKVPSAEVVSAASASHVGVILTRPVSLSYGLTVSNKLFECIMAGLPVILSDVAEHRMLNARYGFGIIIEEMSADALFSAAVRLKEDTALYRRLQCATQKAAKELCWELEGQKLVGIYRAVVPAYT